MWCYMFLMGLCVVTPSLGCNWLKHFTVRTEKCLTELQRMEGGIVYVGNVPHFPNKLYKRISRQQVASQLAFVRDNLRNIYELYRDGDLSSVGWDTEHFLTTVFSQITLISHCVSQNKSENSDVRKYYRRLKKSTVEKTNGSLASWRQISYLTRMHLNRLDVLVQSISSTTTLARHSRETAPEHITRIHYSRETELELITGGRDRTQTHLVHLTVGQHHSQ